MKNAIKRSLSILLAVTIIFSSLYVGLSEIAFNGIFVIEAKAASESDLSFGLSIDGVSYAVTDCKSSASGEIIIPKEYNGEPITHIGYGAFEDCTNLTSIVISENITHINEQAFLNCKNITNITISDSVISIGWGAFEGCTSLASVHISDVKKWCEIDFDNNTSNPMYYAENFYLNGKLVNSIIIPDTVTSIKDYTFYNCKNLNSVRIPNSVTSIGDDSFSGCENITAITIPDSVTSIGDYAFYCCANLITITMSDNVKNIGIGAFRGCTSLATFEIPEGITHIGAQTFSDCTNLTSITIPDSVTSIGENAFMYCYNLESIAFPDSVIDIGYGAFSCCINLTSILLPNSVSNIGDFAFEGCENLLSLTISNNSIRIGSHVFQHCISLETVLLGKGVTSIGDYSFYGCDELKYLFYSGTESEWDNITIGSNNESLTDVAIHYSATDHFWGDWVIDVEQTCVETGIKHKICLICGAEVTETTTANGHCYSNGECSVCGSNGLMFKLNDDETGYIVVQCDESVCWDVSIPSSYKGLPVIGIDNNAFDNCVYINSITIPDSIVDIGVEAFYDCLGLTEIIVSENNISYSSVDGVLFNKEKTILIRYPASKISTNYTIPEGVKATNAGAFRHCQKLTSITIIEGVTDIGYLTFSDCTNLIGIVLPEDVANIGVGAFDGCSSLESITISDGVKKIGNYAFVGCTNLKSVVIPDSVTSIGENVFQLCENLESVRLPNCINSIEMETFRDCRSLVSVVIPDSVTSVGAGAFSGCESLTSIVIPDTVTNVGSHAFQSCKSLKSVVLGSNITSVSKWTFSYCNKLASVTISENLESIGESSFSGCDELIYVFYGGSESEWNNVIVDSDNEQLTKAYFHYGATDHDYEITNTLVCHPHTITHTCSYCADEKIETPIVSDCIECNFTITLIDSTDYKLVSYIGGETDVVISASYEGSAVTTIANSCFKGNTTITSVEIEDGVTSIGSLAFMNCTSLEKVTIPVSVTSIGTQAFYGFKGTIYCISGSFAHEYAVANNIKYVLEGTNEPEEPIQETEKTQIDFDNFLIFTGIKYSSDIIEILGLSESATIVATASSVYGNQELYGTGTIITVFDGNEYIGDFTLIVEGDLNGDSVCDVLDAAAAQLYSAGFHEPTQNEIYAANGCISDEIDVNSYQNVVNVCLAG